MASLDSRIKQLEAKAHPEASLKPIVFLIAGDFDSNAIPTDQHTVIFEIIKPSGDAHATQPKQQP